MLKATATEKLQIPESVPRASVQREVGELRPAVLLFIDDPEYVLKRKRRLADLVGSLGDRLVIAPINSADDSSLIETTLVTWLLEQLGLDVEVVPPRTGAPGRVRAMTEAVRATRAHLVIVPGTFADDPARAAELAAALHRRAEIPVLRFDADPDEVGSEQPCFDRVIASCSKESSRGVAETSAELAGTLGCDLTILDVIDSERVAGASHHKRGGVGRLERAVSRARHRLQRRAHGLVEGAYDVHPECLVRVGDLAGEITSVARRFANPLVVTPPTSSGTDAVAAYFHGGLIGRISGASVLAVARRSEELVVS